MVSLSTGDTRLAYIKGLIAEVYSKKFENSTLGKKILEGVVFG
jgi:hypothetical protein